MNDKEEYTVRASGAGMPQADIDAEDAPIGTGIICYSDGVLDGFNIAEFAFTEALNDFYRYLEETDKRLFRILPEHTGLAFKEAYLEGNYYRLVDGSYDNAYFPLPVTHTEGCDICITGQSFDFYAELDEMLPREILERYRIHEAVLLNEAEKRYLFRMEDGEEEEIIGGFAEELKRRSKHKTDGTEEWK